MRECVFMFSINMLLPFSSWCKLLHLSVLLFSLFSVVLASGPGSVSEIETAMTTGIVMSGAPAERGIGNTEGGEGQPPQPKMINLPLRSLQWRRGRKRWTPSWPAPVGPTSRRPNCVWCRLRSLTRAGWFHFAQQSYVLYLCIFL